MQTLDKVNLFQVRDFSDVMNTTFVFVKQNFRPLSICLIKIAAPILLIMTGLLNSYFMFFPIIEEDLFREVVVGSLPLNYLNLFLGITVVSAVTYSYVLTYMEHEGNYVKTEDVWAKVKQNILMLIVTGIVTGGIVVLGTVLFIAPGIYLLATLSFANLIRLRERIGIVDAIQKCRMLVLNNWWNSFAILIVASVIVSVLSLVFTIPQKLILFLSTLLLSNNDGIDQSDILLFTVNTIAFVGNQLLYSVLFIAMTVQYFNLVERTEATGLLNKLGTLGTSNEKEDDSEEY